MYERECVSIDGLVNEYGSPLFLVSANRLRSNLRDFKDKFLSRYPRVEAAYAYKANSLPELLAIIHKEGAWAEVGSGFEYELARSLRVPGKSIVFNGPYKKKEELKRAVRDGALINVDNEDELGLLGEISEELGCTVEIGLRINMDVGIRQKRDRFGFSLESGEAEEAIRSCKRDGLLRVAGFHVHLTSYIVESGTSGDAVPAGRIKLIWPKGADMYRAAAEKMVRFANGIRAEYGAGIKYLDFGGGFPSVDSLYPYVSCVVEPVIDSLEGDLPLLILEPGRAIVKDAVDLIATVVGVRDFPEGRSVVIDAGINILPTSFWRYQDIEPLVYRDTDIKETTVYGPLCLQTDIVAEAKLPALSPGDRLLIPGVGAYNIPQSSAFMFPRPYILLLEDGRVEVLRYPDIPHGESIPSGNIAHA
mgnify:CR=1 FL=1